MKYLDLFLKALMIGLYIASISTSISVLAFAIYCLLQQSGVTFLTLGSPKKIQNRAKTIQAIDDYVQKHYSGQYTPKSITQGIIHVIPDTKDNLNYLHLYLEAFRNHLTFHNKTIDYPKKDGDPVIENEYEAIAFWEFMKRGKRISVPDEAFEHIAKFLDADLVPFLSKGADFQIGYPRHLQLALSYEKQKKAPGSVDIMLQLGNEYKIKTKLNIYSLTAYAVSILALIVYGLIPLPGLQHLALITTLFAIQQHSSDDFFTLNLGFDPRSWSGRNFDVNPETGKISYSFGVIALNVLINLMLFSSLSLFGAINLIATIPSFVLIPLVVLTAYDRLLLILHLPPLRLTQTTFTTRLTSKKKYTNIAEYTLPAIRIPEPISACIRPIHCALASLVQ